MLDRLLKIKHSGMNLRFLFYFLLFAYVPLLIFSVVGYYLNKAILKQIYLQDQKQYLEIWKGQYRNMMRNDSLLFTVLFREADSHEQEVLSHRIENLSKSSVIGCFRDDGLHLFSQIKLKDQAFLEEAIRQQTSLVFSHTDSAFFKFIPLHQSHYLVIRYPLNRVFANFNVKEVESRLYLFSTQQGVVLTPVEFRVFRTGSERGRREMQKFLNSLTANKAWLTISSKIERQWTVIYQRSTNTIFVPLKKFLFQIIVANLALGILLLIFAIFTAQSISRPIRTLVAAANRISRGHLGAKVPVEGKDEIRDLAIEFESMRQKLLESYQNLEKKIEERTKALREAQFQILHQEKMASLGIMAAGIAHEIGNPLTSISSMTQIIKRKIKDDQLAEYLNTILDNIERISKIVRELVDFSRPSSLEASWVNVNDVIRNAYGIVKYDKRAKAVEFRLDLAEALPSLFIVADQLLQVFLNILINALDALKEGKGLIAITSRQEDGHIVVTIEDNGIGIPEEHLSKIFEPFFTTKEVGHGTGLGLSVSYGIIKNFDGKIEVKSKVGEGSTFIIKLPIKSNMENQYES